MTEFRKNCEDLCEIESNIDQALPNEKAPPLITTAKSENLRALIRDMFEMPKKQERKPRSLGSIPSSDHDGDTRDKGIEEWKRRMVPEDFAIKKSMSVPFKKLSEDLSEKETDKAKPKLCRAKRFRRKSLIELGERLPPSELISASNGLILQFKLGLRNARLLHDEKARKGSDGSTCENSKDIESFSCSDLNNSNRSLLTPMKNINSPPISSILKRSSVAKSLFIEGAEIQKINFEPKKVKFT